MKAGATRRKVDRIQSRLFWEKELTFYLTLLAIKSIGQGATRQVQERLDKFVGIARRTGVAFFLRFPEDHDHHDPHSRLAYLLQCLHQLNLIETVQDVGWKLSQLGVERIESQKARDLLVPLGF